jgi:folylpolyglutamate synthase/dihydropteroate synthase
MYRSSSKYEQIVRSLYRVNAYIPTKMGLDNITALHQHLGSPMTGLSAVHIAGTNGKVSHVLVLLGCTVLTRACHNTDGC